MVALGMRLDSATRLLEDDPAAARAALVEVRELSGRVLEDLRGLVRGIQPPVLVDRGLGDAVRSLALDSFLDVHVEVRMAGRLPAAVESAAYFAVNELLANAAKHSGAGRVDIRRGQPAGPRRPGLPAPLTGRRARGAADPPRSGGPTVSAPRRPASARTRPHRARSPRSPPASPR
ncbi:histidine kinase [Streptomyces sp. NPDC059385]|uniref:sensor histidine kinase n=1 Tax=Streptomyces sp. NPDC059385 TaxID=3346817 RepID=UPI003693C540